MTEENKKRAMFAAGAPVMASVGIGGIEELGLYMGPLDAAHGDRHHVYFPQGVIVDDGEIVHIAICRGRELAAVSLPDMPEE